MDDCVVVVVELDDVVVLSVVVDEVDEDVLVPELVVDDDVVDCVVVVPKKAGPTSSWSWMSRKIVSDATAWPIHWASVAGL